MITNIETLRYRYVKQPKTKRQQRKTLSRILLIQERVLIKILTARRRSPATSAGGHGEAPAQPAHFEAHKASKNIARPIGGPALPRSRGIARERNTAVAV